MESTTSLNHTFQTLCLTGDWQKKIRFVVEVAGVTETDLKDNLGVSLSTIKRWLNNGTKPLLSAQEIMQDKIADLIIQKSITVPVERGPWSVVHYGDRVDIQSDDFTHDAALTVSGDFVDQAQKIAYAQEIAKKLNRE